MQHTSAKFYFAAIFILFYGIIKSQPEIVENQSDSLSLSNAIDIVLSNYPSIKQAETALQIADAKISMAKTAFNPEIDFSGSYTRIGPVPTIDFPPMGEFQLAPENNYNAAINYHQTLWDFGKTAKEISYENKSKEISQQNINQIKQKLTFSVISLFYKLVYLQEALVIKKEQISALDAHLDFIRRKKNTGSATEFEILSTQVKLSNAQSQLTDLETAKNVQVTLFNSLLGNQHGTPIVVKKDLETELPALGLDSMLALALTERNEIKIADEKVVLADLQYKLIKAGNNPVLNLFANAGFKNGYVPDLNELKANYVIGLGVKIPLFYGNRKKYKLEQTLAVKQSDLQGVELVKKDVTNQVVESNAEIISSQKKINQSLVQLQFATRALEIAEVNFKEGALTNIELLDANTNLSESKLSLLKAQIEFQVNVYKLLLSIGQEIH